MDPWWWVPIGLAAWFLVALGIGLFIGPILQAILSGLGSPGPAAGEDTR